MRRWLLGVGVVVSVVVAACGGAATSPARTSQAPGPGSTEPTPSAATAAPSTAAPSAASPTGLTESALVGTWDGMHECERIADMFTDAAMTDQILPNVVDNGLLPGVDDPAQVADPARPCAGAVRVKHAHFFHEDGTFGSLDSRGQQVDDGHWSIVDPETFEIGGAQFHYRIDGDELRMEPVNVGTCPPGGDWCEAAWELMVAMPGTTWHREPQQRF